MLLIAPEARSVLHKVGNVTVYHVSSTPAGEGRVETHRVSVEDKSLGNSSQADIEVHQGEGCLHASLNPRGGVVTASLINASNALFRGSGYVPSPDNEIPHRIGKNTAWPDGKVALLRYDKRGR